MESEIQDYLFLTSQQGSQILANEKWTYRLSDFESKVRTRRTHHYLLTDSFTTEEANIISLLMEMCKPHVLRHASKLWMTPVSFIKLQQGVDWDFPFTVKRCICLTQGFINKMLHDYYSAFAAPNPAMIGYVRNIGSMRRVRKHMCTLVHELVHIHQRYHPDEHERYYIGALNMRKAKVIKLTASTRNRCITNPDGLKPWVFRLKSGNDYQWFYPCLMLSENEQLIERLITVKPENADSTVFRQSGEPFAIDSVTSYSKITGIKENKYHPNETLATLVSEWIILEHEYFAPNFRQYLSNLNLSVN